MARAGDSNAAEAMTGTARGWPVGARHDACGTGGSDAYSSHHCRRYGSGCVVYGGDRLGWRWRWP
jgi:hypothetical protein